MVRDQQRRHDADRLRPNEPDRTPLNGPWATAREHDHHQKRANDTSGRKWLTHRAGSRQATIAAGARERPQQPRGQYEHAQDMRNMRSPLHPRVDRGLYQGRGPENDRRRAIIAGASLDQRTRSELRKQVQKRLSR